MAASVVVIGNFDGVHLGHQFLLDQALQSNPGARLTVLTFWPHPMTVIRPDRAPKLLCTLERRVELLRMAGVDDVRVVRFDESLATLTPEAFVREHLAGDMYGAVVVGENFRFGHRASGDVDELRRLGEDFGFEVIGVKLHAAGPGVASSTSIRTALDAGDVARAQDMLGREFAYDGVVVRGKQRGRAILGMPTANLAVDSDRAVPADGIYAGWTTRLDGEHPRLASAISVGTNPTFGDLERRTVESYVIDRDDLELYDVPIRVEFSHRLRGMVKFEGLDGLRAQMAADVRQAKSLLRP